mmetsp:Transcript_47351/g.75904  ORF Transcript_47351/g.75904 Transcript_47351/m.75904 type:complete len:109 (-) Transcript_47351:1074-1400(-)
MCPISTQSRLPRDDRYKKGERDHKANSMGSITHKKQRKRKRQQIKPKNQTGKTGKKKQNIVHANNAQKQTKTKTGAQSPWRRQYRSLLKMYCGMDDWHRIATFLYEYK